MSSFDPDANASANGTWDTTFLSDRDVSSQVPINFVPHPGVHVTAACFGNGVYDNTGAENCLSNLLSSQIRRYVIDLYWDTVNRSFNLCPIGIPFANSSTSDIATSEGAISIDGTVETASMQSRQVTPTPIANRTSITSSSTTSAAVPSFTVLSNTDNRRLIQLGQYQCSDTLTLALVISVFSDYLERTSNTLEAKILLWVINLHVATPWDQIGAPVQELSQEQLPASTESVGTYFDDLEDAIYEPGTLLTDRENLNSSWFGRQKAEDLPLAMYYSTTTLQNGDIATADGWPTEEYIQVSRGRRMLIGFGNIDEAMTNYNTTTDGARIFPSNYIYDSREVTYEDNGELSTGCFYNAGDVEVKKLNNSWAVASINAINPPNLGDAADNLTSCGISQSLNITINGLTADTQGEPYQSFGNDAVFSWAYFEPQNDSSQPARAEDEFRCALMISSHAYRGHWRVEYCNEKHRVACREAHSPYGWRISGFSVPYDAGEAACTGNTTFDTPRTGLENKYLYSKILADAEEDQSLLDGVWINFNSLEVESCWITTGINGSCPYYQDASATGSRQILIPAIAALIVLLLTALTILVKCSSNARNSRIRKRGEGGWDYEGVPS